MKIKNTGLQAITTKYLGPTDFRGARIKATAQAGSITIAWDHGLDPVDNHAAAAAALCKKMGWDRVHFALAGAKLPGGNGFVFIHPFKRILPHPMEARHPREWF